MNKLFFRGIIILLFLSVGVTVFLSISMSKNSNNSIDDNGVYLECGHCDFSVIKVEPTCECQGFNKKRCNVCDFYLIDDIVKSLGHSFVIQEVLPTCDNQGYTVNKCERCDNEYIDRYIEKLNHSFGEVVIGQNATCTQKGYGYKPCERENCEYFQKVEFESLGHSYGVKEVLPTCDNQGYTVNKCERCDNEYMDQYVEKLNHSLGEVVIEQNATCAQKGRGYQSCERENCEYLQKVEFESLGHDLSDFVTEIEMTCLNDGLQTSFCQRVNCDYEISQTIKAEHTLIEDKQDATCVNEGYSQIICSKCDYKQNKIVIAKLNHNYIAKTLQPTCVGQGYTIYTCSECSESYNDNFVKELGHDKIFHSGKYANCSNAGWHPYFTCSRCDYSTYQEISINDAHNYEVTIYQPTCQQKGYTKYQCIYCGYYYECDYVEVRDHYYENDVCIWCNKPNTQLNAKGNLINSNDLFGGILYCLPTYNNKKIFLRKNIKNA